MKPIAGIRALCFLLALAVQSQVMAKTDWSFYPSDEFNDETLRPRWTASGVTAMVSGGRLRLFREGDGDGQLLLRSVWAPGTKVPLLWPWAIETSFWGPNEGYGTDQSSGLMVRWSTAEGDVELRAGLNGGRVVYGRIGDQVFDELAEAFSPRVGGELFIRLEGVDGDGRRVRAGFKTQQSDPWHWTPVTTLEREIGSAAEIGFSVESRNESVAGEKGANKFDYIRFEGECFQFDESDEINYVRPVVPETAVPPIEGEYYDAIVPETIDYSRRAALALNACTAVADPLHDYEPYSHIYFNPDGWQGPNGAYNPDVERGAPVLVHDYHGYNTGIGEGIVESVPLLALATGNPEALEIGHKMFETMRKMTDEQGQTHAPLKGRPWALFLTWWLDNHLTGPWVETGQYTTGEPWRARAIGTLAAWHAVHPDPIIAEEIRLMVDNVARTGDLAPTSARGLLRAYQAIGYQPALDLARKYADAASEMFAEDGSWSGHFHVHTQTLLSLLDLAVATDDEALLDHVRRAYEFAKTKGWPIVGVFPEGTDSPPYPSETCELAEMVQLAVLLSHAGAGDYWDDVDRWARNQLAEQQLVDTAWISELTRRIPKFSTPTPAGYPGTTDVEEKIRGGFSSYGCINEWSMFLAHSPGGAVGCCTGNGSLAVYIVWRNILSHSDEGLRVNLLMNRASKWADIDSHVPYEGKVEVHMKQSMPLWVRMPEWVTREEFICGVGGDAKSLRWDGRYASPGTVGAGETVTFTFPMPVRAETTTVGEIECTLTIKGNTVIKVDPPGKICPIYRRDHYAADKAPMKKVRRFAPAREVEW